MVTDHRIVRGIEEKQCGKCQEWKPLLHFALNKTRDDGLSWDCRECHNDAQQSRVDADSRNAREATTAKHGVGSQRYNRKVREWATRSSPEPGSENKGY